MAKNDFKYAFLEDKLFIDESYYNSVIFEYGEDKGRLVIQDMVNKILKKEETKLTNVELYISDLS